MSAKILIIGTQPENLDSLITLLNQQDYLVEQILIEDWLNFPNQFLDFDLLLLNITTAYFKGQIVYPQLLKAEIPTIVLSPLDQPEDKIKALNAGVRDYLTKPFHPDELSARLNNQMQQIREQRKLQEQIKQLKTLETKLKLLETALSASENGIVITDPSQPDNPIIYANEGITKLTGYAPEEIIGKNCRFMQRQDRDQEELAKIHEAIDQGKSCRVILRNYRKDGTLFWNKVSISPVRDQAGNITNFIGIQTDITESQEIHEKLKKSQLAIKKANQELQRLALYDDLTQVANRRRFNEYLNFTWVRLLREPAPLSLILCDIDYYKKYNDYYGHLAGDNCLKIVAQAIERVVKRQTDLVARYGGEEFAIILPNTPPDGAMKVGLLIRQEIQGLQILHQASPISEYITISLGISSLIPTPSFSSDDLIRTADQALYQAKEEGRNRLILKT